MAMAVQLDVPLYFVQGSPVDLAALGVVDGVEDLMTDLQVGAE